jgi:hypothetical protein
MYLHCIQSHGSRGPQIKFGFQTAEQTVLISSHHEVVQKLVVHFCLCLPSIVQSLGYQAKHRSNDATAKSIKSHYDLPRDFHGEATQRERDLLSPVLKCKWMHLHHSNQHHIQQVHLGVREGTLGFTQNRSTCPVPFRQNIRSAGDFQVEVFQSKRRENRPSEKLCQRAPSIRD